MIRARTLLFPLLLSFGCNEAVDIPSSALSPEETALQQRAGSGALTAMTWNVYYGADIGVLMEEAETPLPVVVAQVFGAVQATDAPGRAAAIARQIAAANPHAVGLQEVAHYRLQSPGDVLLGNLEPNATETIFDFLALLTDELEALGHPYVVARRTNTFDVELPVLNAELRCDAESPCDDLRFTESVAVLTRADVAISNATGGLYSVNLPVEVAGMTIELSKGWASVDVRLKERTHRFVTTHLEWADFGPDNSVVPEVHQIQLAQAAELLAVLDQAEVPVILTGDLNTEPGGTSTDTYEMLTAAGFVDTWYVGRPRGNGFTANQEADLTNSESLLWHRIDYILYRDHPFPRHPAFRGSVHAEVVGEEPQDRTQGGLWPSDHAGVVAELNTSQRPMP